MSDQDDIECKLDGSYFTDVVVKVVLQVCEKTRNLENVTPVISQCYFLRYGLQCGPASLPNFSFSLDFRRRER